MAVGYTAKHRSVRAGIALGLAVLTRTTALLYIIPFALLPLANRRMRPTSTVLPVSAIIAAIGFALFLLADGASVIHSLITYRSDLPIAGGSFWLIARGSPWAELAQYSDAYLILTVATTLTAAAFWLRPSAATTTAGFFGLLTVIAACFPMLAKTTYLYYLLEPYVFAALWWLIRPGSALNWRLAVPLLLTADAFLAKWGANLPFNGTGLVEGVASSPLLALVIGLVLGDMLLGRSDAEPLPTIARTQHPPQGPRLGENRFHAVGHC